MHRTGIQFNLLAMGMLGMAILQGNRHSRLEIPQSEEGLEPKFLTILLNRAATPGQVVDQFHEMMHVVRFLFS